MVILEQFSESPHERDYHGHASKSKETQGLFNVEIKIQITETPTILNWPSRFIRSSVPNHSRQEV
jgi:hypothetical protein